MAQEELSRCRRRLAEREQEVEQLKAEIEHEHQRHDQDVATALEMVPRTMESPQWTREMSIVAETDGEAAAARYVVLQEQFDAVTEERYEGSLDRPVAIQELREQVRHADYYHIWTYNPRFYSREQVTRLLLPYMDV